MKERLYEQLLNINTTGNKSEINNSIYYHPYEPTPYRALEELFEHYKIAPFDTFVDFGCGKGRLNFFINYQYHNSCKGIEMNIAFYENAIKNRNGYWKKLKKHKGDIQFHNCLAEKYEIQPEDNKFYFFNPFSVQVFMKVIHNILHSVEQVKREVDVILYYPSNEYLYFLDNQSIFNFKQEVRLSGLYEKNTNERFLIYHLD